MTFHSVRESGKLHLVGLLLLLHFPISEAALSRPEAPAPHCLLQRSQQTQRRPEPTDRQPRDSGSGRTLSTLPKDEPKPSLVQASAMQHSSKKLDLDPSFFSTFADAESTFDEDGGIHVEEAANPDAVSGESDLIPTIEPPNWFYESASAGPKEAWQTYDPESEDASWRAKAPEWTLKDFGRYEQTWAPTESREKGNAGREDGKEGAWFDTAVDQYDLFGRPRAPSPNSARFYAEWSRVSRTAEWSCGPPGCVANASLKVFENLAEREYKMCRLSVSVHATDFDDQYERERIEWIVVNGKEVVRDFAPQAPKGCETDDSPAKLHDSEVTLDNISNSSLLAAAVERHDPKRSNNSSHSKAFASGQHSQLPLYPCVRDLPLEGLVDNDGELKVSGKITMSVDECPVNGNHLSGVVAVTCFARQIPTLPPTTTTTTLELTTTTTVEDFKTTDSQHLGCEVPGCVATTVLSVDDFNLTSRKCTLTLRINQTDFDGQDGTSEVIEWIKVNGKNATGQVSPGKNPCQKAAAGDARNYSSFVALEKKDVTDAIKDGMLKVSVKISNMVDECAVEGRLLDGQADLSCR